MKAFLPAAVLLGLLGPVSAWAGTLTIPMNFEYLALDGQVIKSSMFKHKADLNLTPGEHKIAIRYSDMVEDDYSDSQNFIKSAPFIVTLTATQSGQYALTPAQGRVKYPEQFAKQPDITLQSNNNAPVTYHVTYTDIKDSHFLSRLMGDDSGVNINEAAAAATLPAVTIQPQTTAVTANVNQASPAGTLESQSPQATKATTQDAGHAEQMLQYWWQQADEPTRKAFMSWAIKQL